MWSLRKFRVNLYRRTPRFNTRLYLILTFRRSEVSLANVHGTTESLQSFQAAPFRIYIRSRLQVCTRSCVNSPTCHTIIISYHFQFHCDDSSAERSKPAFIYLPCRLLVIASSLEGKTLQICGIHYVSYKTRNMRSCLHGPTRVAWIRSMRPRLCHYSPHT